MSYAANPDKTIYSDICKALHYASDERKTVIGEEKAMYVTGVNCTAETAFAEMKAVQERFDKTVGNVAYHAYQSFKTGEVTPQLAHKLGVELAKECGAISIKYWSLRTLIPAHITIIWSSIR